MTISSHKILRFFTSALLLLAFCQQLSAQTRYVDPSTDESRLPYDGHVLTDRGDDQIVRFRNWDAFNPVRTIRAGTETLELPNAPANFSKFSDKVDGHVP